MAPSSKNSITITLPGGLDSAPAQTAFGEYVHYAINAPLKDASLRDIVAYRSPALEDFNFNNFALDLSLREEHFFCTGILNYVFILASWLRGQDQFFITVKKYDQIVLFHCCGNCTAIIPDFIEIGVDILDPVQTSAAGMDLAGLKSSFGNDLCFHGGIDVQRLLPFGSPQAIKEEVRRIQDLFGTDGGLILGPSHEIPNDVPVENIIAIYSRD